MSTIYVVHLHLSPRETDSSQDKAQAFEAACCCTNAFVVRLAGAGRVQGAGRGQVDAARRAVLRHQVLAPGGRVRDPRRADAGLLPDPSAQIHDA